MEFDFNFDFGREKEEIESAYVPAKSTQKKSHRRTTECTELSTKYEYRRAFSEVRLLEALKHVPPVMGRTYNFITGGDVDSLSYLKYILNRHSLDYLLFASWVICAEDFLQLRQWYEAGRIKKLDCYLGEIFPNQYKVEFRMVRQFYEEYPDAGRIAIFNNHAKIWAGYNETDDFWFSVQGSANATQNPRTEQACIQATRQSFEFYKSFFDGINSFLKD